MTLLIALNILFILGLPPEHPHSEKPSNAKCAAMVSHSPLSKSKSNFVASPLGSDFTFLIEEHKKRPFIFRGADDERPHYAQFLSEAIRQTPSLNVAKIEILSSPNANALIQKYDLPILDRKIPRNFSRCDFIKGRSGTEILNQAAQEYPARKMIIAGLKLSILEFTLSFEKWKSNILTLWHNSSADEKESITQIFRDHSPKYFATPDHFSNFLNQEDATEIYQSLRPALLSLSISTLAPKLRNQVADYWAISVIFGIPDPHPSNWIIDERNEFWVIDINRISRAFELGAVTYVNENGLTPLGSMEVTEETVGLLKASISPEMSQFIRRLKRKDVIDWSRSARFQISDVEINGILSRAQMILEGSPSF